MIEAYPITWPREFPRTAKPQPGKFQTTLAGALKNVEDSLRRFGADSGKKIEALVISSNVTLGAQRPADPGVAVWFTWDGIQVCIPVDRYDRVEHNLQAIHHIVEARRTELRHGGLSIVRATFMGFKALPAPGKSSVAGWRVEMEFPIDATPSRADIDARFKKLRSVRHPDKGGNADAFAALQAAYGMACQEVKV